jgi:DNA-binding transcriptional LysR family regulator
LDHHVELRHLRTFLPIAETLNVSEAARRLRVTQPALSRQVRGLEHAVGHALFVRHSNGMRLTATGVALRNQGAKALLAFDLALHSARGAAVEEPAVLRVGYYGSVSIWAAILSPALKGLARKHPHVTCNVEEMSCGQLAAGLREGRLEVAVLGPGVYRSMPGVALAVACIVPGMAMIPVNHRLAKKRQVSLEDLRGEEIVSVSEASSPGRDRSFIAACRAAGFTPRISRVASNLPDAIVAITQRMGVGVIGAFASMAPHPGVVFVKIKSPGVQLDLFTAHVRASPAARHLAELIGAEARRAASRA